MNFDRLKTFVAVAKHRSLTKASAELHLTQSAISKQLKCLEDGYQRKLYRCVGSGIDLTAEGAMFVDDAEILLSATRSFNERWNSNSTAANDYLVLGGSYGPSGSPLPEVISNFTKAYPRVQILLRTGTRAAIEQLVLKFEVEVGVVTTPSKLPGLIVEPLRKEKLVAFVSARHPLAQKSKIKLSDVAEYPFVIRGHSGNGSTSKKMLKEFKRLGIRTKVALTCDVPVSVKAAVGKRLGIGLLYRDIVAEEIRNGEFKMLRIPKINLEGQSFIILPKDKPLSARAKEFLVLLRKSCGRNRNHNGTRLDDAIQQSPRE